MNKKEGSIDYIEFPVKSVKDLHASKSFYSEVFGWQYQDWGPDYSDTGSSGIGSGLNADAEHRTGTVLAVIYTRDLDEMCKKVRGAKARITREIFSFPGGRRFHFIDPAGNELAVWSDS